MPINPISAEQLYFKPFKTLPSLVDGIIPKGMTVLAGSSKIGKSWMALDLAIAVASGGEFLGRHVRQAGVLYLCLEDTEKRVQDRMYQLCDEAPPNLYFSTTSDRLGCGFTRDVVEMLRKHPDIELIIIDTLQKVRQSDDSSGNGTYSKDYEEIAKIKKIADVNDRSILVLHHLRKQPDKRDPFNEISGSVAICGASDTNMVLKKQAGSSTAELYIRGRDVEEHKLILEYIFPRWSVVQELNAADLVKESVPDALFRIADFIREHGTWSGSATELLELVGDSTIAPNKLMQHITRHYYNVLYPAGISYEQKKEAKLRRITLRYDPSKDKVIQDSRSNDDSDGNDGSV